MQGSFRSDFLFRLTNQEVKNLALHLAMPRPPGMRSQIATASKRNIRFLPYVFTEHGAIMAANVLNSQRALIPPFVKRGKVGFSFRNLFIPHSLRAVSPTGPEAAMIIYQPWIGFTAQEKSGRYSTGRKK
jgi:hypothetical protein